MNATQEAQFLRLVRTLCAMSLNEVATRTGVEESRLCRFELGRIKLPDAQVDAVESVLRGAAAAHRRRLESAIQRWQ